MDQSVKDKSSEPVVPEVADWVLFTQTRGGKVSLIKGLTKGEARQAARRAAPIHMLPGARSGSYHCHEGTINRVEIFRGNGETADIFKDD